MRILVVEDEARLASAVQEALVTSGHAVDLAADGEEGESLLESFPYDLVILDIGLPKRSGLEVCRRARDRHLTMPILMLTARDTLEDKIAGLDSGADDYLIKPFDVPELQARVRALLRRNSPRRSATMRVRDLVYDPATGEITRAGDPIKLPRKERALLEVLMRNAGRVVTREKLIEHVWDMNAEPDDTVLRAHIKALRRALGDAHEPRLIQTLHGIGYRMSDDVQVP